MMRLSEIDQDESKCSDYSLSNEDADELKGMVLLPLEMRRKLIDRYFALYGYDRLIDLFANFIGLATSVVTNTRETLTLLGIIEADMHPHTAEKLNAPSLFGAIQGAELANSVDQNRTCHGCAFRLGSLANQSPSTTSDVNWCMVDDGIFMCHEHLDDAGNPTVPCGGHQQILKRQGN